MAELHDLGERRSHPTQDIPHVLRNLADLIEKRQVDGMEIVSTCVVSLGHTRDIVDTDGSTLHYFDRTSFVAGPRQDAFTVGGLLAFTLAQYTS